MELAPLPQVPSPVVTVHTSPRLNFTPRGISGWGGGVCSRMSFSTSSSAMQASPRMASPTLQMGVGEGVEGEEAGGQHGLSLRLFFVFTEPGFLYTAQAVLELVILLPQHHERQNHRQECNSQG